MKVSILLPVYNVENYIARCLDSLICQTYENIEIIIVNDATPDKSMDIAKAYASEDDRICIYEHTENMGLMWARKTGCENATGDYIIFCDSDDWMPSNAVEVLLNSIIETSSDIVYGSLQRVNENGDYGEIKSSLLRESINKEDMYKAFLTGLLPHSLCRAIYSKKLFEGNSYIYYKNQTNSEDMLLTYQLIDKCSKITCIDDVVYYYYYNSTSSSSGLFSNKQAIQIIRARNIVFNILSEKYPNLLPLFLQSYIKIIILLINRGCCLETILMTSTIPNAKDILSYANLKSIYGRNKAAVYHLILNNSLARWFYQLRCLHGAK